VKYNKARQPQAALAFLKRIKDEAEAEKPPAAPIRKTLPVTVKRLWIDWELAGPLDLKKVGADNFLSHPATKPLLVAFGADDSFIQPIDLTVNPTLPDYLLEAILNPETTICAWNASFERKVLRYCYRIDLPAERFFDPSSLSRYLTHPGKLSEACRSLDMGTDGKDSAGTKLIALFCKASKTTQANIKKGQPPIYYKDRHSHPEQWAQFIAYCVQDVVAMRDATRLMESITTLPDSERLILLADQAINETGIPIDRAFVENANRLMNEEDARVRQQLIDKTGMKNPNSDHQIKKWLADHDYPMVSVAADCVEASLINPDTPGEVKEVLALRKLMSGAGPKKLKAILNNMSSDGRLRGQHVHYGASATGRWSGRSVQPQNLPKPEDAIKDRVEEITNCIRAGHTPDDIDPVSAVTSTIRSSFRPGSDKVLVIADYSMIEVRTLADLSGCKVMLDAFRNGEDVYKHFGAIIFNILYEEVTKKQRDFAKVPILGCGYQMGAARFQSYCKSFGHDITIDHDITIEEAQRLVTLYRDTYHEIQQFWKDCHAAAMQALQLKEIIELDDKLVFDARDERFMSVTLPSGRKLYYRDAHIILVHKEEWGGMVPMIVYRTQHQYKPADGEVEKVNNRRKPGVPYGFTDTYPGKLTENVNQAYARCILADGMTRALAAGLKVVTHIHDELVVEANRSDGEAVRQQLQDIMCTPPSWNPNLIVGAEAYISDFYRKEPKVKKNP